MEPSTSSSWNLNSNNSTFWPNGAFRKRKAAATDLDEKINQKMFVTEDKMIKEMQTLSLELAAINNRNNTPSTSSSPSIEEDPFIDEEQENDKDIIDDKKETHLEIHQLLKDRLKNDDLQDSFISKLVENERKKLAMQIVPYIPIHPGQLNNENISATPPTTTITEEDELKNDNDDYIFKIPSVPTPYTVEEPCDTTIKRGSTMKRSYSQSDQYNSNLSVTELKSDGCDNSSVHQFQPAYFIVEPSISPLHPTISTSSSSSLSSGGASIRITEFIDNQTSNNDFINTLDDDDDIDMQSVASSDTGDKMDDDD